MRVVSIAFLAAALAMAGCHKRGSAPPAQAQLQPQEVNWNQSANAEPAKPQHRTPAPITAGQLAVNGGSVTVRLSNVTPGTELTLAWFGPSGWSVTSQTLAATGDTMTFPVPKFETPGRYQAELLGPRLELLGTIDVNM